MGRKDREQKWQEQWHDLTGKMSFRLFLLLIGCGFLAFGCFWLLMQQQSWFYVNLVKKEFIKFDAKIITEEMQKKAENIRFADYSKEELLDYLEIEKYDDGYTSILFYDEEGKFQFYGLEYTVSETLLGDSFWYNNSYYGGLNWMEQVEFQDTTETIMVYSMHQALIAVPYFCFSLFLSMLMFLPAIIYVWRRMQYVGKIKEEILIMADGDLEHPVTVKGKDEIGILAWNLDEMRLALEENIRKEQEGKKANHELVRSVSHDLRTPMTTLYGYLEILDQKRCPQEKQGEYIRRCIEKVEEIRALSDKMFEYALIYEKKEQVELKELFLWEMLEEMESSREFLVLNGFQVEEKFQAPEGLKFIGNRMFFQRIFNNLFSNILKYGDREKPVCLSTQTEKGYVEFGFCNWKRRQEEQVESNRIGLKSVRKMVELQGGRFFSAEESEMFAVTIGFPLHNSFSDSGREADARAVNQKRYKENRRGN